MFHLAGTWSLPLIDRDEPRFAEASREMLERGDYVVPYFNNKFRFDKPPLTYWFQVASYRGFGENDFAARFPTAIAAAALSVSIFAWGSRIGGKGVGIAAAVIFATSLQVFLMAKAATADMWMVLFATLAHWAAWELLQPRQALARHWWWIFYFSLALAFLAKGPIGWIPLLTVASTIFYHRQSLGWRAFRFLPGILLMLALVCAWGIPALLSTSGEFFRIGIGKHVVARSVVAMEGHGASSLGIYLLLLPFYFITVFASFFPWSIKLPALAKGLWQTRDLTDSFLVLGTLIVFVIFTLVRTKLPHYTLPAFPLMALLLARQLVNAQSQFFRRLSIFAIAAYALIALAAGPLVAPLFASRALFEAATNDLKPEMEFGAVEYNEPSLVWYFRSRVRGFMADPPLKPRHVRPFMEKPGPRFVILPTPLATSLYPEIPPDWKRFTVNGWNVAKGKTVDLTLLLKPQTL